MAVAESTVGFGRDRVGSTVVADESTAAGDGEKTRAVGGSVGEGSRGGKDICGGEYADGGAGDAVRGCVTGCVTSDGDAVRGCVTGCVTSDGDPACGGVAGGGATCGDPARGGVTCGQGVGWAVVTAGRVARGRAEPATAGMVAVGASAAGYGGAVPSVGWGVGVPSVG